MANEIVFIGAGPIGLWTAIQIKLQRPNVKIVFKEKHEVYQRTHTLFLNHKSLADCVKDEAGIIEQLISQLKSIPHIRTNVLETSLLDLAKQLGIVIEHQKVDDIENDVLRDYPDAAMVVGSDGVRSQVRNQVFGEENAQRSPLAYAAQIKYSVKGKAVHENQLFDTYPLLKQSNYLASVNVGKTQDGTTPVTIQHFIDKETYEKLKNKATFQHPIKIFSDNVDEQLPPELLKDVKTQIGFRLTNGEDVLVDSVNLTVTELPQQRCQTTTLQKDGVYYGLIGDAALALSFFKGMNTGLKLATHFSKYIVDHWEQIIAKDPKVFTQYEEFYDQYAEIALQQGFKTQTTVKTLQSSINTSAYLPFQFLYFGNNQIADFHRQFDVIHQISQFYLEAYRSSVVGEEPSSLAIKAWFEEQMPAGLVILKKKMQKTAENYVEEPKLHAALLKLANLSTEKMNFSEKAFYGLAISRTCALLENPQEQAKKFTSFIEQVKNVNSSASLMISSLLEVIAGLVLVSVSVAALVGSVGMSTPASVAGISTGGALLTHGFYKLYHNMHPQNDTYKTVQEIKGLALPDSEEDEDTSIPELE
jgi:2-polyprenyl-6-methoxyphenol hydroxylase-like FAD-dependent oxidoreductase